VAKSHVTFHPPPPLGQPWPHLTLPLIITQKHQQIHKFNLTNSFNISTNINKSSKIIKQFTRTTTSSTNSWIESKQQHHRTTTSTNQLHQQQSKKNIQIPDLNPNSKAIIFQSLDLFHLLHVPVSSSSSCSCFFKLTSRTQKRVSREEVYRHIANSDLKVSFYLFILLLFLL